MRPALLPFALLTAVLAAVGAGCSGAQASPDAGPTCPSDLPASCPSPEPSYASQIAPLIESRCLRCHSAGGQASDKPLGTWDEVHTRRSAVLNQVYGCRMPPTGEPQPTSAERQALLGWLVCGSPNN